MDVTTEVVLTGVVVVAGMYAKDKKFPGIKFVVGSTVYLLFLTAISASQPELASKLGLLVLVTSILIYMTSIVKKLGFSK